MIEDNQYQDTQDELEKLREENKKLKSQQRQFSRELSLKVSQKGAVSLYGMGRFPVTLYKEQWLRLLDFSDHIRRFISDNKDSLKSKT